MPSVDARRMAMRFRLPAGLLALAVAVAVASPGWSWAADSSTATRSVSPEWILRSTVRIHHSQSAGSGTIIASTPDETLILTAWHVIDGAGDLKVALHRYNYGLEKIVRDSALWPRMLTATVAASNKNADLAIVRLKGVGTLPYVARMELADREPPRGTVVASVGIVQGNDLTYWESRVWGQALIDFGRGGGERLFIMTQKPPEFGRSGGGLYRIEDQTLIGVAVGQAHLKLKDLKGPIGVFAGSRDVRELLESRNLDLIVAQSRTLDESRRRSPNPSAKARAPSSSSPSRSSGPARTQRPANLREKS